MDVIEAACEVVLGLLMPDDFEQRSNAGPKHVDPLVDDLGALRDLEVRRMDLLQVREGKCGRTEWGARPSDACCWLGLPDAQAAPATVWLA